MPNTPATDVGPTTPTGPLTDTEREALALFVVAFRAAFGREIEAKAEGGRQLRAIRDAGLYRAHPETGEVRTIPEFAATIGLGESSFYDRIALADVADDLAAEGAGPVTAVSHALHLAKLRASDPETQRGLRTDAYRRAAEMAGAGGVNADHVEAACDEVRAALLGPPSEADGDPFVGTDKAAEREAVWSHRGLVVVVPAAAVLDRRVAEGGVLSRPLPNKALVPYEAVAHDEALLRPERERPTSQTSGFARTHLDDLTDLVWPVLSVDPWTPASEWALPEGQALVTFHPDRLDGPRARLKRDATERDRTVLLAPGVDLLHPDVPEAVMRAVVGAAGADSGRRYLLMTAHPGRAWADGWPQNVFFAVVADGTARSDEVLGRIDVRHTPEVPHALVARDLGDVALTPMLTGLLPAFGWVLVRGPKTSQAAYDALRGAVEPERFDRGRDVRARHSGYPPVPEAEATTSGSTKGRRRTRRPPAATA